MPLPPRTTLVPRSAGANGSSDHSANDARIETALGVTEVSAHYERQIVGPDWTVQSRAVDGNAMAVTRYRGKSATGDPVTAMLIATSLTGDRMDLDLRVTRMTSTLPVAPPPSSARGDAARGAARRSGGLGAGSRSVPGVSAEVMNILLIGPLSGPGEPLEIKAGPVPAFPAELLPADSKVLASASSKRITSVVADVPSLSLSAVPRYLMALRDKGVERHYPLGLDGFRSGSQLDVELCRGSAIAKLMFIPRERPGVFLRASALSLASDPDSPCQRPGPRVGETVWGATIALPLLMAPPGANGNSGSGGGGLSARHARTRITTNVPLATIADGYAAQMTAAGWKLQGRIGDTATSVARFSSVSTTGAPVTATLTLTAMSSPSDVAAWFRAVWLPPGQ